MTDDTSERPAIAPPAAVSLEVPGPGKIDRYVGRWVSRKLAVWAVATVAFVFGKLTGDLWVALSLGYIGAQGVADIASQWKHGRRM